MEHRDCDASKLRSHGEPQDDPEPTRKKWGPAGATVVVSRACCPAVRSRTWRHAGSRTARRLLRQLEAPEPAPTHQPPALPTADEVHEADQASHAHDLAEAEILYHRVGKGAADLTAAAVTAEAELLQGDRGNRQEQA